jgi:hypothetical protein
MYENILLTNIGINTPYIYYERNLKIVNNITEYIRSLVPLSVTLIALICRDLVATLKLRVARIQNTCILK